MSREELFTSILDEQDLRRDVIHIDLAIVDGKKLRASRLTERAGAKSQPLDTARAPAKNKPLVG